MTTSDEGGWLHDYPRSARKPHIGGQSIAVEGRAICNLLVHGMP